MPITITLLKPVKFHAATLEIVAPVDYGEEDMPHDFPGRTGKTWRAVVDLDTGRIAGWPAGKTASLDMKVRDGGVYILRDLDGKEIGRREDYVPGILGGGDYLEFTIDEHGTISTMRGGADADEVAAIVASEDDA